MSSAFFFCRQLVIRITVKCSPISCFVSFMSVFRVVSSRLCSLFSIYVYLMLSIIFTLFLSGVGEGAWETVLERTVGSNCAGY